MTQAFGRSARPLWSLAPNGTFLNHGSFGACPISVQEAQSRLRFELEKNPDRFFLDRVLPAAGDTPLRQIASQLGRLVGVSGDDIAFVENATVGIQAVLESIRLAPGDEILLTNHQYNAVRLAAETRSRRSAAVVRIAEVRIPAEPAAIRSSIRDAANERTKLAIIDHITSASALVFPVKEIVAELRQLGIPVLIDGAHAVGQIPLDIGDLRPTWYVSNAHKWLFAPRGTAFLYVAPEVAAETQPIVTSHFAGLGFPRSFDYVGTRDYTSWLALPAATSFFEQLNPAALRTYMTALLDFGSEQLLGIDATPVAAIEMCAAMRAFILPQRRQVDDDDARKLVRSLWDDHRIQIMSTVAFGRLIIRLSAQAYVDEDDFVTLRSALTQDGWPGR